MNSPAFIYSSAHQLKNYYIHQCLERHRSLFELSGLTLHLQLLSVGGGSPEPDVRREYGGSAT